MRRTTLAALCLTAVTVAGVAGCLPGDNKAADKSADKTPGKTADNAAASRRARSPG